MATNRLWNCGFYYVGGAAESLDDFRYICNQRTGSCLMRERTTVTVAFDGVCRSDPVSPDLACFLTPSRENLHAVNASVVSFVVQHG